MVKLYSLPHCPRCELLNQRLVSAGIDFQKITDRESIERAGLMREVFPILDVNGQIMKCSEALKWLNRQIGDVESID